MITVMYTSESFVELFLQILVLSMKWTVPGSADSFIFICKVKELPAITFEFSRSLLLFAQALFVIITIRLLLYVRGRILAVERAERGMKILDS